MGSTGPPARQGPDATGVYPFAYARCCSTGLAIGAAAGFPDSGVCKAMRNSYTAEALTINRRTPPHWIDRDPELKCYLPGIPRAMYIPIVQSVRLDEIEMAHFSNAARAIHGNRRPARRTWMGH